MKTRFLLGVLLLFSITMQGQQVKVNYENITNSLPIILQVKRMLSSLYGFDIPIISYTSGISVQGGIWFCGLRDSKVEPRKWYEKYGIDDYVYYTIRLEEDKPSSKGTVYVKISK